MEIDLFRVARAFGLEHACAKDVVQETYLSSLSHAPNGLDDEQLRKWVYRVAVNQCKLVFRRSFRMSSFVKSLSQLWKNSNVDPTPLTSAYKMEERRIVQRAMDSLEPKLRLVLVLRYYVEFNSREIGEILGMSESTVRSQIKNGRQRLATNLHDAGIAE